MKIWKNTKTLDGLVPELINTVDAADAEVAVIGGTPIDLSIMAKLKTIFKCGVGTDNVPFEEAKARGIEVVLPSEKTKAYIFEETANFAVHLVLRMLYSDLGSVESWQKKQRPFLSKKNVLVIGQGNIGKIVNAKLHSLTKTLTYDSLQNEEDELKGLIRQADAITLHLPLIEKTRGFIDAEKLSWMKDGAILINTARGPIVDELALYEEIKNKRIIAAFDVFWQEPYSGILAEFHPEYFYMTPHVASNCSDFLHSLAEDFRKLEKES